MSESHESLIRAELVWDGGDEVRLPSHFLEPAPNQMLGSAHARLGELSARICYDSCGVDLQTQKPKGRSTAEMHKHLIEVKNHSVYEHCTFTIKITGTNPQNIILCLVNRPGVWVEWPDDELVEVTLNHRVILEWDRWTSSLGNRYSYLSHRLGNQLWYHARELAPEIYTAEKSRLMSLARIENKTENLNLHQAWVSLYLRGSRGLSHEQVRHGDWTAISQRCLGGDSLVTFVTVLSSGKMAKKSGFKKPRTMRQLYRLINDPRLRNHVLRMRPRVFDESTGLFTYGAIEDVVYSGAKECFELVLEDGKTLKCTKDHRIMTERGWKTLEEIANPCMVGNGVVQWNRDNSLRVGTNGIAVELRPSERKPAVRRVKIHYQRIVKINYAGEIDTYDLVLRGPNHGFVANGVVVHNSTRFCSEEDSPYVTHPLTQKYLDESSPEQAAEVRGVLEASIQADRQSYKTLTERLAGFLRGRGVQGTPARKQAWGASRGYLGNALVTELIFSASCRQWRHMISERASVFADAEIRQLYAPHVLNCLKASRYGHFFEDIYLVESPDGIGQVAVGGCKNV